MKTHCPRIVVICRFVDILQEFDLPFWEKAQFVHDIDFVHDAWTILKPWTKTLIPGTS